MNNNTNTHAAPVLAHVYDWDELRCVFCDVRPSSRHASEPCEGR